MLEVKIPLGAKKIIEKLEKSGCRADIVGGCVRDALLGRVPYDFDITTAASPDEMLRIFRDFRVIETGLKHGTLTVMSEGDAYEVTSYRIDGEYRDGRHPETVSFTSSIEEDLARRDFTVNAMAYSEKYGLTDLFSGREDLGARMIRTVGIPEERFSEDALRILRALRFASVLSFEIEEKTAAAVHRLKDALKKVSYERIYSEWMKLLGGDNAYKIISEFSDVISVFLPELSEFSIAYPERFLRLSPLEKMIFLLATSKNEDKSEAFRATMRRLKSDKSSLKSGMAVLENAEDKIRSKTDILHMLSKIGEDCTKMLISVQYAMGSAGACEIKLLNEALLDGSVYTVSGLALGGCDINAAGIYGKDVGDMLSELLEKVINGELKNEKNELLSYIKQVKKENENGI